MANTGDELASMISGLETVAGLSRAQIARAAGVSRMTVWRYAEGEARQPSHDSYERIDKLCRKVGVVAVKDGRR